MSAGATLGVRARESGAVTAELKTEGWTAWRPEQRGIDLIPTEDRLARPRHLYWMWTGSTLNVLVFVYGTLIVRTGLSFYQSVAVIAVGTAAGYAALGLVSLTGPAAGTGQLTVSRAAFGYNWNRFNAVCNWLFVVGYEVIDLSLIVLATLALLSKAGVAQTPGLKVCLILAAVAVQLPLPLLGHASVLRALRPLAVLLAGFFVVMAVLVLPKVHPSHLHQHTGFGGVTVALALTLSAGGFGWASYGADYSRYLPPDTPRRRTFAATMLGGMVPQMLIMLLGAAAATTFSGTSDEIGGLPKILPGWFSTPYLVLAIVSLYAVNTVDLYSSGLNLQATGLRIRRWQAVCVDMAICTVLLFPVVFSNRFNTWLSDFLLFDLVWLSPWFAIVITDWALRRGRYHRGSLFRVGGGLYWRDGGIHWPAAVAQVVGMVGSAMWLNASPAYVSPLSRAWSGSDLDILLGGGLAGLVYVVLARREVRREGSPIWSEVEAGAGDRLDRGADR